MSVSVHTASAPIDQNTLEPSLNPSEPRENREIDKHDENEVKTQEQKQEQKHQSATLKKQNYTKATHPSSTATCASEQFAYRIETAIDHSAIQEMLLLQSQTLSRFEKTNAKLDKFNEVLAVQLAVHSDKFKRYTQLLIESKKDLEYIFRKIRALRSKLTVQYPEAFIGQEQPEEDEEDDDY